MGDKVELSLYTWEEIKKIFSDKKFDNVILFSQPRSGSTFVSHVLSKELHYDENFFPEEFFINKHFSYLRNFIRKHDNFFLQTPSIHLESKPPLNNSPNSFLSEVCSFIDLSIF